MKVGISRNTKALSITLAVALVLWVGSAAAQEQRCNELASSCTCSEPLDTAAFTHTTDAASTEVKLNPTDTNAKQCNGGSSVSVYTWDNREPSQLAYFSTPAPTGMPAKSTVSHVWHWGLPYGALYGWGNASLKSSTKRVCVRHYLKMSTDFDGGDIRTNPKSPNCDPGKFTQFKFHGSQPYYDVQMGSGGRDGRNYPFTWWRYWNTYNANFNLEPV